MRLHRASLVVAFFAMGVVGATIPATIPGSALRMHTDSDQLLQAISALFLGLFVGVVVVAVTRRHERRFLITGLLLLFVGLAFLAASVTPMMFFVACALNGLGYGLVETSATALTRSLAARSTSRHLAVLNGSSAVAAALSPLFIAAFPPLFQTIPVVLLCTVPLTGVVIAWVGVPCPKATLSSTATGRRRMPIATLVVLGFAVFVFVGAETVLSGWSSVLPQTVLGSPVESAALGTSAFWVLAAAGRFICAGLLRRGVSPERYLVLVLLGAAAFAVSAAIVGHGPVAAILVGAAIVSIAPVYALLLGRALTRIDSGNSVPLVTGALVAAGAAGGVVISFFVALGAGSTPAAVFSWVGILLAVCLVLVLAELPRRHRLIAGR
ncbi:MFS transporter [Rathayibacter soli]|uniref:MFS transporter n=1 Tax=Rathayibacter soli TaxID=3144168 RepID=UPI0027E481A3|nr:MFS transporter [Glaciibacter superstes]